jgi:regulator of sigma E protease
MMFIEFMSIASYKIFLIAIGLLGLSFLVTIHELGHWFSCKLFKVHTPSFSIGFGPKLFTKKIGDTDFSISAIPVGGYVEIAGNEEIGQGEQQHAHDTSENSFSKKPYWQQMIIMGAGILMNIIFAYLVLITLFWTGMPASQLVGPYSASTTIKELLPESPAIKTGLREHDTIISLNGTTLENDQQKLKELVQEAPEQSTITISRENNLINLPITITSTMLPDGTQAKIIGIKDFEARSVPSMSFWGACKATNDIAYTWSMMVIHLIGNFFSKETQKNLGGPIMIISQTAKSIAKGWGIFFLILAFISLQLALLNLIPLPIFDGGQMFIFSVERLVGKTLCASVRNMIGMGCWILFWAFFIYISIQDIYRLVISFLK